MLGIEIAPGTFASRAGADHAPRCDGVIVPAGGGREPVATVLRCNPLAEGWRLPHGLPAAPIVIYSGTLAGDLSEPHPRNWLPPGRAALDASLVRLLETTGGGGVSFLPHCRHVLSDPPSCLRFLVDHEAAPVGIVLAPALMIEPSMLADLEDHLERMFRFLGERCSMVMLGDVKPAEDGGACAAAPMGEGVVPGGRVGRMLERYVPDGTLRVVKEGDAAVVAAWLEGSVAPAGLH